MADVVRHIGLSLGADVCWPLCFEALMKKLDLRIPTEDGSGDTIRFEVERVFIEPYDLRQPCKYDLVVDRLDALVPHEPRVDKEGHHHG